MRRTVARSKSRLNARAKRRPSLRRSPWETTPAMAHDTRCTGVASCNSLMAAEYLWLSRRFISLVLVLGFHSPLLNPLKSCLLSDRSSHHLRTIQPRSRHRHRRNHRRCGQRCSCQRLRRHGCRSLICERCHQHYLCAQRRRQHRASCNRIHHERQRPRHRSPRHARHRQHGPRNPPRRSHLPHQTAPPFTSIPSVRPVRHSKAAAALGRRHGRALVRWKPIW